MNSVAAFASLKTWLSAKKQKQASYRKQTTEKTKNNVGGVTDKGRRVLLLSAMVASTQPNDSRTQLLNKYLKKSEENKAKNTKERLDDFYKRNYKDYFGLLEGSLKQKKEQELTESEKGILDWLDKNK